jgi:uncharacterized protein (TIGR00266 family)
MTEEVDSSRIPEKRQSDSVLDSFEHLEHEQLQSYCQDVSIQGEIAQNARISFAPGQQMWASKGSILAYDEGIDWELKVPGGAGKAVSRMLSGEGISMNFVTAQRQGASVTIGSNQPGKLVTWDLSNGPITCTSGAFVAALGDVEIDVTVARKAGAAFFGGAGLFMQRLSGEGIVIVHGSGDFIERKLGPHESVLVSTGNLACFSDGVSYDIQGVGGCFKSLFGGEGIFMTKMTGPGWVMLQSLKKLPTGGKGSN